MPLWLTTPMTRPESFSSSCTGRPSGRLPDASTRSTTRSTAGTSLERAWEEVRRNRGAPGVDGVTIAQVERQGVEGFLDELAVQLQDGTYRPLPVRRVTIPKPQGGERNLGVPGMRDREVQAAAKAVLEPIFEADFLDCSFGFRPGRSAHQALEAIRVEVNRGRCWVVDADIASFFDSIRPEVLGAALAERVSDRRMRKLIMGWLKAGVLAGEILLHPQAGTPQGGVATPPTQWITRAMVALRVGLGLGVGVAGVGVVADRDAVTDGDLVGSDEDVFDDQPQHALALLDAGHVGLVAQLGEEAVEGVGEFEVQLTVGELGVERLDLATQAGFAGAQVGHPATQLIDGEQLLLERLD